MRFILVAVMAAGVVHGATIYSVVDLGPSNGSVPSATPTTIPGALPGGSWITAYGTNAAGDMTGYGDTSSGHFRAFVWTPAAGLTMLGTLGGLDSWGMAINDGRDVAGHSTAANGYIHAFLSTAGGLTDLGTLGGTSSYAFGINNSDAVVGSGDVSDGTMNAFLYSGGIMKDLNSLIPANSGWVLDAAYSIDNRGRIIGSGSFEGQSRAFELDPFVSDVSRRESVAPEPSTFVLLGLGLLCFGRVAHTSLKKRLETVL